MNCRISRKRSLLPLATLVAIAQACTRALADDALPADYLQINAPSAKTYTEGSTQIIVVDQPLSIETDGSRLTAKSAVIWITPQPGAVLNRQRAEIALIGDATLEQSTIQRSGDRLFVSTVVGGSLRLCVEKRENIDPRSTPLYRTASDIRPLILAAAERQESLSIQRPWIDASAPGTTTQPTTMPSPKAPVFFSAGDIQTTTNTPDGNIALVLRGNVILTQRGAGGELTELQAQECVLFTTLTNFTQLQGGDNDVQNGIVAAYLEGDVRINVTPSGQLNRTGEQRLRAKSAYYEFGTDRAVLSEVVLQATDPKTPFPVTMRANVARQLAKGEYDADHASITTSQFLDPSYALNAEKIYVRQFDRDDGRGATVQYEGQDVTFRAASVPIFYLPRANGEFSEKGEALRNIALGSARGSGIGIQTEWGLFQSFGQLPPPGIDASFRADYYSDRGPAGGIDATYKGSEIAQTTQGPWNFEGALSAYVIPQDDGTDRLGRFRPAIEHDNDIRARVQWEHQQILPDNFQAQFRAGYVSDPTFLEEWYQKQFDEGEPTNLSAYVKHQKDTEAITFLMVYQPNDFVTTADALPNRFVGDRLHGGPALGSLNDRPFEVDRLPEIGYYRVGDSLNDDTLTFFSENRAGGYRMHESDAILGTYNDAINGDNFNDGYGFGARRGHYSTPGVPNLGYTGTSDDYVLRGDSRQEIDYPIDAGPFKVVPYAVGRYTGYSDSPDGDPQNRILAGVGARISTAFWKIDDAAQSDFFDIHRTRHVIEPELNVFASGSSIDRDDVYIYDQNIDGINDVEAASFWIRQRWQTKRGGPGLWRSVDFLTFDVGIMGFGNKPHERENPDRAYARSIGNANEDQTGPVSAKGFRGLYFQSTPEASIPRSSIAANTSWRISDTTILLGDASWNIDEQQLATTAVGFLVGRGDRVTYYAGLRYIGELDSTIASFSSTYQISSKYTANFSAAVDLSSTSSKGGSFSIIRKFDRFFMGVGAYYDAVENQSGFNISLYPEGVAGGVNTGQLQKLGQ